MCKDQLCVKHAKFLSPFVSINHHKLLKKHKARVFIIRYCKLLGGGEVGGFGGEASPPPPTPPSR